MTSASYMLFVQHSPPPQNANFPEFPIDVRACSQLFLVPPESRFLFCANIFLVFLCFSECNPIFYLPLCVLLSLEIKELIILKSCYFSIFLNIYPKRKIIYVCNTHIFKESLLLPFSSLISLMSFLEYYIFQLFEFTEVYLRNIFYSSSHPRLSFFGR